MTQSHIEREKEFHNQRFSQEIDPRRGTHRFYAVFKTMYADFKRILNQHAIKATVLEYGCGNAKLTIDIAEKCNHITAIDISDVAIANNRKRAMEKGLQDIVTFLVMNAEELQFPDQQFDFVFGAGILHHLVLSKAIPEIARVLKPEGVALFNEPMGHNPIINLFRKLTPKLRSPDEHPLLVSDFQYMKQYFQKIELTFYGLLTPYVAILPKVLQNIVLPPVEWFDRKILKMKWLQRFAWFVIMKLER